MKKIISLLLCVAMVSTFFVVSVSATNSITYNTVITSVSKSVYEASSGAGVSLPSGYAAYKVSLFIKDYGTVSATDDGDGNLDGRRFNNITYELAFDDIDAVPQANIKNKKPTTAIGKINKNPSKDGSTYKIAWTGDDTTSLPAVDETESTYDEDDGLEIIRYFMAVDSSKNVAMTVGGACGIVTYTSATPSNQERYNNVNDILVFQVNGSAGNTYTFPAAAPTTYTVTYKDENGTPLQTTASLSSGAATPAAPAYTPAVGYQLDGWSTTQGGAVASIPATVSANADYFAVVSQIDYTVTFYDGDTPVSTKTDYHYGDTLVAPADPSKVGFTFSGWSTSPSGAVADLPATVTGGAVYYAQFASAGPSLPADIGRKAGRAISKFTSANGALPTLKPGQTATVETDADYYITEFDTNALNFAEYDYAIKATADDESYHTFDRIDGANLAEVAGNINFFVIIKKVTDKAHEIVDIVVKAFAKE